jgi:hypothetical protein
VEAIVDYVPGAAIRDQYEATTEPLCGHANSGTHGGLNKDEFEQENTILRRRLAITHETNRRITAALTGLPAAT